MTLAPGAASERLLGVEAISPACGSHGLGAHKDPSAFSEAVHLSVKFEV